MLQDSVYRKYEMLWRPKVNDESYIHYKRTVYRPNYKTSLFVFKFLNLPILAKGTKVEVTGTKLFSATRLTVAIFIENSLNTNLKTVVLHFGCFSSAPSGLESWFIGTDVEYKISWLFLRLTALMGKLRFRLLPPPLFAPGCCRCGEFVGWMVTFLMTPFSEKFLVSIAMIQL